VFGHSAISPFLGGYTYAYTYTYIHTCIHTYYRTLSDLEDLKIQYAEARRGQTIALDEVAVKEHQIAAQDRDVAAARGEISRKSARYSMHYIE